MQVFLISSEKQLYSPKLKFTIIPKSMPIEQEIPGTVLISPISSASFLGAVSIPQYIWIVVMQIKIRVFPSERDCDYHILCKDSDQMSYFQR